MSNYTKTVNFAAKDALTTGDPNKVIQGTEIDTEFANISTAVATKADKAAPTFTGLLTFAQLLGASGATVTAILDEDNLASDSDTALATQQSIKAYIDSRGSGDALTTNPLSQFAATTSAQLAGVLSDETGSGAAVFATSPTLVTPILGTPTSGTLTNATGLPISTGVSGLGTGVATALAVNVGSAGAPVVLDGALGTPSSGTLTNATGLPAAGVVGTAAILGANTFTDLQTFKAGADIASATTVDLTAATGNTVVITGTTTTTALTMTAGQQMVLLPSGAWPLTYNATTMNINGGASYTCAAGDRIFAAKDLAGVIRVNVVKQDGTAVVSLGGITLGTPVASTSGTSIDFTGIPSGTKRITVQFHSVSTTGNNSRAMVQIGDSGGIETTGYVSGIQSIAGAATGTDTTGFLVGTDGSNTFTIYGSLVLTLVDAAAFKWECFGIIGNTSAQHFISTGGKALSAELTQLRITTVLGTATFDDGTVNITYE